MSSTAAFVGSVPRNYHRCLGPLLFEPYAQDMAARLRIGSTARALEIACGTGIVTRAVVRVLPGGASLVATDLNQAMVDEARTHVGAEPRVTFQVADAQSLPFDDRAFGTVFCQFGVMFFPDKPLAMREARRVLQPGGRFVFNVWSTLDENPMSATVHRTMAALFPSDPPDFLRTPFGWNDRAGIEGVLRGAGFTNVGADTVDFTSRSVSADEAARGFVQGSPMAGQLQSRGVTDFEPITRSVAEALARHHGAAPCQAPMRALVFSAS